MRKVVKFLLALVIFSSLSACCIPMHSGYGSHGNHGHVSDESHEDQKQGDSGHSH